MSALSTGSCIGQSNLNTAAVGSNQAAFAGVLAGVVFAGIVILLSIRSDLSEHSARALKLLFCSLFGVTISAFLLATQAADVNCLRTLSEETVSEGILGTFSVIIVVALTWLVIAYGSHARGVLRSLRLGVRAVSLFIVVQLATSSCLYLKSDVPHSPSISERVLIYAIGFLLWASSLRVSTRIFLPFRALLRLNRRTASLRSEGSGRIHRVDFCSLASLIYLGVAAIFVTAILAIDTWNTPQKTMSYIVVASSLILPLSVVTLALHAMAADSDEPEDKGPESEDVFPHQASRESALSVRAKPRRRPGDAGRGETIPERRGTARPGFRNEGPCSPWSRSQGVEGA